MAGQNQGGNLDQFESFFKRADLDQDGRISGAEAVAFFQGSGLNKQVLAQIWMHADEKRAGFLGRQEFYNALKLVTVAQSKRELTPEIVKSALYGPASSRIPPPQINLPPAPTSQPSSVSSSPAMQMGAVTPTASQNLGYRGPVPPNQNMQQQYFPSPGNQSMRPSQALPASSASLPYQSGPGLPNLGVSPTGLPSSGFSIPSRPSLGMSTHGFPGSGMSSPGLPSSGMSTPGVPNSGMSPTAVPGSGMSATGLPNSGVSNNWMGGNMSGAPYGHMSQIPNKGTIPSTPQNTIVVSQAANNNFKATNTSVDGFSSNSVAGSDPFSAFSMTKSGASPATSSVATLPTSSAIVPVSASSPASSVPTSSAIVPVTVSQPPLRSSSLDSLQSAFVKQPLGGQTQQPHGFSNLSQSVPQVSSSGVSPGPGDSTLEQSQPSWPKMTTPGIQKYTKVFMEVDTDRDGKITGEQARNLFLSWRLPREVLKQVWDLADQDNDSMLSLREFCIALYLMERYREGRSLPTSLPNSIMFDETLMRMTGIPNSSHGNAGWGATSGTGYRPVHGIPGSQPVAPTAGPRPVMQSAPQPNAKIQFQQPKSKTSVLDNSQAFQLTDGEQNVLQSSPPGIIDAENKVGKVEKVILDSREKLEFYRTKMQELVLYKSRCDNRLNEIIERASADKREADLLGKKYEEKYKQVAEIASKLTIEEAKFREYQERKTELQQAILNMEQGGSPNKTHKAKKKKKKKGEMNGTLFGAKRYTLSFDGSHNNQDNKAGAGCIIRDSRGELVIAAAYNLTETYPHYCNVAIAEAEALKNGLILAKQKNLHVYLIKGDSKEVIDHVLGNSRRPAKPLLSKIIQQIVGMFDRFSQEIVLVDREANKVADKLAFWGSTSLQGGHMIYTTYADLPPQVAGLIRQEKSDSSTTEDEGESSSLASKLGKVGAAAVVGWGVLKLFGMET